MYTASFNAKNSAITHTAYIYIYMCVCVCACVCVLRIIITKNSPIIFLPKLTERGFIMGACGDLALVRTES